jgi:hypothetical protein
MPLEIRLARNSRFGKARARVQRLRISATRRIPRLRAPRFVVKTVDLLAAGAELTWRVPLVLASAAMLLGGVLHSNGQQRASALVVTAAIAIAMIAVPLGLLGLRSRNERAPGNRRHPAIASTPQPDQGYRFPPAPPRSTTNRNPTLAPPPVATKHGASA